MGRNLSEAPRPDPSKGPNTGKIDIVAEAGLIAAEALKATFRAEFERSRGPDGKKGCTCRNCRGQVMEVFDRVNEMLVPSKKRLHEATFATGSGAVYPRELVPWARPGDYPPSEWHGLDNAERPYGIVSRDEDDGYPD